MLRIFAKGQFLDAAMTVFAIGALLVAQAGVFRIDRRLLGGVLAVFALRCGLAWVMLVAWRSVYADFYFGTRGEGSGGGRGGERGGGGAGAGGSDGEAGVGGGGGGVVVTHVEKRAARFIVRGREAGTGREVEYASQAKSEELARKSAAAMGLEEGSVRVEEVREG